MNSDMKETMTGARTVARVKASLPRRQRAERRFRWYGRLAVGMGVALVLLLFVSVIAKGYTAFVQTYMQLPVTLDERVLDPAGNRDPEQLGQANYGRLIKLAMLELFPEVRSRATQRELFAIPSSGAVYQLRDQVRAKPELVGQTIQLWVPADDDIDMLLKGRATKMERLTTHGEATPSGTSGQVTVSSTGNDFADLVAETKWYLRQRAQSLRQEAARLGNTLERLRAEEQNLTDSLSAMPGGANVGRIPIRLDHVRERIDVLVGQISAKTTEAARYTALEQTPGNQLTLTADMPSYLVRINGGVIKVQKLANSEIVGQALMPLGSENTQRGSWDIVRLATPEADRRLNDRQVSWVMSLKERGLLEKRFNVGFFTGGASREPELAGIWGAVVGSFYTLTVTLVLSLLVGIAAAVYLEEFAPRNRLTDFIEININNLAAVPSIVFGLLGLAVFVNFFGISRSTPLVAGMVLGLMTLPTIIIASRSSLRAVPPSIRDGALGIGASKLQTITHHVLPLALPGMLTGTIIGMAQALGETAPLLMIGMVAFIMDVPGGVSDPATVLPVQIYLWAESAERAFEERTAGAIMVLLAFLIVMNAFAVFLRRRLERRW